jgi:hypothetical protein
MKFLLGFLLAQCLANSICVLSLQDGTSFSYKAHEVNGVYPEGLGSDGNIFYTIPDHSPIGCVVNVETGMVTCGGSSLGNQTNQKAFTITIS